MLKSCGMFAYFGSGAGCTENLFILKHWELLIHPAKSKWTLLHACQRLVGLHGLSVKEYLCVIGLIPQESFLNKEFLELTHM